MKDNIKHTKQKLTSRFVAIVFLIILIFGITFFSIKHGRWVSIEKREYQNFARLLDSWNIKWEDIKKFTNIRPWDHKPGNDGFKRRLSYLQITKKGKIISSNIQEKNIFNHIQEKIKQGEFVHFIESKNYEGLQYKKGFFVKGMYDNSEKSYFIVFKPLHYTLEEYLEDIFVFLIVNIVLSVLLYIVGKRFINRTFIPVEENIKDMKDFVHNAGHELKTPISVIDSNIQLIDDIKKYDPAMTKELKSEVLRLNGIIDGLIELSNIDNFHETQENNLYESVFEILSKHKKEIEKKKITIKNKIDPNIKIIANSNYLHIFLANLIKNAIKYNVVWGTIDIQSKDGKVIIADSGIGIEKKEMKNIFKRFYKCDISRNSEWFWIWLSLVSKISDIYNWNIEVKSKVDKGTKFVITF